MKCCLDLVSSSVSVDREDRGAFQHTVSKYLNSNCLSVTHIQIFQQSIISFFFPLNAFSRQQINCRNDLSHYPRLASANLELAVRALRVSMPCLLMLFSHSVLSVTKKGVILRKPTGNNKSTVVLLCELRALAFQRWKITK